MLIPQKNIIHLFSTELEPYPGIFLFNGFDKPLTQVNVYKTNWNSQPVLYLHYNIMWASTHFTIILPMV